MAKPRIFISSTFYDLKYVREGLEVFIRNIGYEPVLFEKGDIPFHSDKSLAESCYQEVEACHMLVLIVGGRLGSVVPDIEDTSNKKLEAISQIKSVTRKEYERARDRDIPVFIFVEKNVLAEHRTYSKNKNSTKLTYAYVDSDEIYKMLDSILEQRRNNYIREFDTVESVIHWLRDQWAGLFADSLARKSELSEISSISNQISTLQDVANVIKNYSEAMIKGDRKSKSAEIIKAQTALLRKRFAARLYKEKLNVMIRVRSKAKISPIKFLEALEKSKTPEQYLKALGIGQSVIRNIIETRPNTLKSGFHDCKNFYAQGLVEISISDDTEEDSEE